MSKGLLTLGSLALGSSAVRMYAARSNSVHIPGRSSLVPRGEENLTWFSRATQAPMYPSDPLFGKNPNLKVLNPQTGSKFAFVHSADGANLILNYLRSNPLIEVLKVRQENLTQKTKYWVSFTGKTLLGPLEQFKLNIWRRNEGGIFYEIQIRTSRTGLILSADFKKRMEQDLQAIHENKNIENLPKPWKPVEAPPLPASADFRNHLILPSHSTKGTRTALFGLKLAGRKVKCALPRGHNMNEWEWLPSEGNSRALWEMLPCRVDSVDVDNSLFNLFKHYQQTAHKISAVEAQKIGITLKNVVAKHPEVAYYASLLVDVLRQHTAFIANPQYLAPVANILLRSKEIGKYRQ